MKISEDQKIEIKTAMIDLALNIEHAKKSSLLSARNQTEKAVDANFEVLELLCEVMGVEL